jgi:hypothetical protein
MRTLTIVHVLAKNARSFRVFMVELEVELFEGILQVHQYNPVF